MAEPLNAHIYATFGDGVAEPTIRETILLIGLDGGNLAADLTTTGYQVTSVLTGEAGREAVVMLSPDMVVLDLVLPDTDGLVLISNLRLITRVPIVVCSTRHECADRVLSLRLGADDFIDNPFDTDELEARIEAVLRRSSRVREVRATAPEPIRLDALLISHSRGTVTVAGQDVHLTPTEHHLLVALASRPGEVLSRGTLCQVVWGYEDLGTGHLIDVHMGRVRRKVDGLLPQPLIRCVRGVGFTIDKPVRAGV